MSMQSALAYIPKPIRDHSKRIDRPSVAVREAVRLMIEAGIELDQAAAQAGLTTRRLRLAFEQPSVREYVKRQSDVFRAAVNAKNNYRLAQIRDAADNMPAVNAIKELRAADADAIAQSGIKQTAGVVIQIVTGERNMTATHQINASECNALPNDNQISNPLVSTDMQPPSSNSADDGGVGEK